MRAASFTYALANLGGKERGLGCTGDCRFLIALVRLKVSIERDCITLVATAGWWLMSTAFQGAFMTCYNLEAGFCIDESIKVIFILRFGQTHHRNKAQLLGCVSK